MFLLKQWGKNDRSLANLFKADLRICLPSQDCAVVLCVEVLLQTLVNVLSITIIDAYSGNVLIDVGRCIVSWCFGYPASMFPVMVIRTSPGRTSERSICGSGPRGQ